MRQNSKKRFGARYGRRTKQEFAKIESDHRKLHKCPFCSKNAVKRLAAGIWQCKKCLNKFAGKSYTIGKISRNPEIEMEEKND